MTEKTTTLTDNNIYSSIEQEEGPGPFKCKIHNIKYLAIEGYILFCSGIHEEAQEDNILDLFSDFGRVKSLHANLDKKTGYLKGYVLVEYETLQEAQKAVNKLNGCLFMGKKINVSFAYKKKPVEETKGK